MGHQENPSRRNFVRKLLLGVAVAPLAAARLSNGHAADLPLLSPEDPAARKVKYTEDATREKSAVKGNQCSNCALYEGVYGSAQGPCQLFTGKQVKAAGWCSSWAPQI
jgi:High potential iron-sulfur protein